MVQRLFVYGTLAPGRPNEHVMNAIGGTWEEASVKGFLKPQGWGAELGYPGIILDDAGDEVTGYLFSSENLAENWAELDEFEGKEYQRVQVKVRTKGEKTIEAHIYILRDEKI